MLETDPGYIQTFSLVIVSNVDPPVERRIAEALWNGRILLLSPCLCPYSCASILRD